MPKDTSLRLRAPSLVTPFRIVLVEPEIPQNTGNIARLAAATQSPLHLVGRLGFRIDEKAVRRAGLDYWHLVTIEQHLDLAHFHNRHPTARLCMFTATARTSFLDAEFQPGDALVFGKESVGLAPEVLENRANVFGIPTLGAVRSLNLANAVAIVLYEALRQAQALSGASLGSWVLFLCLLLASLASPGCGRRSPSASPDGAARELVERMKQVNGEGSDARAAFDMLSLRTRSNLAARAQRYGAASGKAITPDAMLVPSRFALRFTPQRYSSQVSGLQARVFVSGALPRDHAEISCVYEDGAWKVDLGVPPLTPIQVRPPTSPQ